MNRNVLLLFMLGCYLLPILIVIYYYDSNTSVSNVICNETCKHTILFFMGLMGIGTILYEIERNDTYSQICIVTLLIGIYGLVSIDETHAIHYVFACLVFGVILFFMIRHCYLKHCNRILTASLCFQLLVLLLIGIHIHEDIFYPEVIYILNFAFYYLYLHVLENRGSLK